MKTASLKLLRKTEPFSISLDFPPEDRRGGEFLPFRQFSRDDDHDEFLFHFDDQILNIPLRDKINGWARRLGAR